MTGRREGAGTHLVLGVVEADRRLAVPPLAPVPAPPLVERDTDLTQVLGPEAVAVPAHDLDALLAEGEAVVQLELEFGFAADARHVARLAAGAPDRVERLGDGRARDL